MNMYLTIMVTVLVVTQIIRLIQNAIQLKRQQIQFEKNLGDLAKCEPTVEDFETQRIVYRLMREKLEKENDTDREPIV